MDAFTKWLKFWETRNKKNPQQLPTPTHLPIKEKKMTHNHTIGFLYKDDCAELVTLDGLKKHIAEQKELKEAFAKDEVFSQFNFRVSVWELSDYGDRRKTTDLHRFNHCCDCGARIDWKGIKDGKY
jgi:hypothetical protein